MADENSDYPIIQIYASEVKSYLRPMESMTKKEKKVVNNLIYNKESIWISPIPIWVINESDIEEYIDFCNSHHHDTETALNYVQNRMIVETCKNSNVEIEGATFKIVHKDKCEKTVILLINKEEAYHLLEEIQIILQNKVKKYKQEFEEL